MKSFYLILLFLICIISCDNQPIKIDDIFVNDTIGSYRDKIITIYENSFFPLDTNDIWIYRSTEYLPDDVADSIDESEIFVHYDTIQTSNNEIIGHITARRFIANYFNTQPDKVTLVLKSIGGFDSVQLVDILYTRKKDTMWIVSVKDYSDYPFEIEFIQSSNKNQSGEIIQDELKLLINGCYFIGLGQEYIFKENIGIVNRSIYGGNYQSEYDLIDYINY